MSIKERTDWFSFPAVDPVEMLRPEPWRATRQAGWQKQSMFQWHRGLPHSSISKSKISPDAHSPVSTAWMLFFPTCHGDILFWGISPTQKKLNIILTFCKHPDIIWPESFSPGHLGALSFSTGASCLVSLPGCPTCNPQASWSPGQL